MPRRRSPLHDDAGSTLPLIAVFAALAIALILVASAATSLYLERKRLLAVADGAALAGAESFELADLLDQPDPESARPVLDDAGVRAAVDVHLAMVPSAGDDTPIAVLEAGSPDGTSATVTLGSVWRPPILAFAVPDGVAIEATATARSVFG
jgi:uncharacterized membrane protein